MCPLQCNYVYFFIDRYVVKNHKRSELFLQRNLKRSELFLQQNLKRSELFLQQNLKRSELFLQRKKRDKKNFNFISVFLKTLLITKSYLEEQNARYVKQGGYFRIPVAPELYTLEERKDAGMYSE